MKQKKKHSAKLVPDEVLQALYNDAYETAKDNLQEESVEVYVDLYEGDWNIEGTFEFDAHLEDDSFTHEFGVYESYHYELDNLTNYDIKRVVFFDEDDNEHECDFPHNRFENIINN